MKRLFIIFLGLNILLTACGPDEKDVNRQVNQTIEASIKETVLAGPQQTRTSQAGTVVTQIVTMENTAAPSPLPSATITPTDLPDDTLQLTETLLPTETLSPSTTPSSGSGVIRDDPAYFLLDVNDLPANAHYFLPGPSWMGVNTNEDVIESRGDEAGKDYVNSTGRETGSWVNYQIGDAGLSLPDEVYCFVGRYSTAAGAQLSLTDYGPPEYLAHEGWEYEDYEFALGDDSLAYARQESMQGGGLLVWRTIEFTYRNMLVQIQGYGYNENVSYAFLVEMGEIVLQRLMEYKVEGLQSSLAESEGI